MAVNLEDDKIILALKQTLQHISLQQTKFKDIDTELQQTKQELENEKNNYFKQCSQLKTQTKQLHHQLDHFKTLSEEQASIISEMKIKSAEQIQENTALTHQLNNKTILMEEIKVENERNSLNLVKQLENDNKMLQKQISTLKSKLVAQQITTEQLKRLQQENAILQQQISNIQVNEFAELEKTSKMLQQEIQNRQKIEKQYDIDSQATQSQLKELEHKNKSLQKLEKDTRIKYQNYCQRMLQMGKCSFNMLENCRDLRRSISGTTSHIMQHRQTIKAEFQQSSEKIGQMNLQNIKKSQKRSNDGKLKMNEAIQKNLKCVKETKLALNGLRKTVEKELMNFGTEIKSVERVIFKQKSIIRKQMKEEQNKTAKLEQSLSVQMENGQNMKDRLKEYLKMKDELQNKIGKLEGFLKAKNEKNIVTEMKRFRSAAIVTSVTCLSDDGNKSISYHKLSQHEQKAISLKSKFQKQINSEININEKVDEFIRSGGLKRYPILEQEFNYEPNDVDNNRFRFGTKYISISYNAKHNELYVKNDDIYSLQLLQDWISKNASNEMRKLLAKVSKKKKANKQILQPKKHVFG